jgi:hypothetical protein
MTQHFNYYKHGTQRLSKSKFEQLPIIKRLVSDDVVEGIVYFPKYREDDANSYYLVLRGNELTRFHFNNCTTGRIPYGDLSDTEFVGKYGMSKAQHQQGHWAWKDKVEGTSHVTYIL